MLKSWAQLWQNTDWFPSCRDYPSQITVDGLDWAVLFDRRTKPGSKDDLASMVDGPMHNLADGVKDWPR
jgi:hypothetical protein